MSVSYFFSLLSHHLEESPLEFISIAWFLFCFLGYTLAVDNLLKSSEGLSARMHLYRIQWMKMALTRQNRVVDINVIGSLQQSVSFFASTSIIILAGLLALLGAGGTAIGIVKQIPFTATPTKLFWYSKLILLIYLYIYAFFKYTWALRQLNYSIIMVGAMPPVEEASEEFAPSARRAATVCTMAVREMNRGLRAYYFSIATLASFVNPWLFMIASGWIVVVIFRREFKSRIVKVLNMPDKAVEDPTEESQS